MLSVTVITAVACSVKSFCGDLLMGLRVKCCDFWGLWDFSQIAELCHGYNGPAPYSQSFSQSFRAKTAGDIPPNKNEMFHNTHQTRGHQMNRQKCYKIHDC